MTSDRVIQTIAHAYRVICTGELPWVAIGNFLNEWFECTPRQHPFLVAESIELPEAPTDELWRWAVFCAAAAEWLCAQGRLTCPAWARDPTYTLADPWYGFDVPGAHKPEVRAHLLRTTPEPFARRNIYGGDRMFANKYEFAGRASPSADVE